MNKNTLNEKIFQFILIVLMFGIVVVMLYPMWYVLVASFSDGTEVIKSGGKLLWIKEFTPAAYKVVFENKSIWTGYQNTLFILFVGTFLSMIMTILGGYFLAKKNVLFKGFIAFLIVATMYFNGGMIPKYFNVRQLGLFDSVWALIIPCLVNTFNLIIMRTAFECLPASLAEAANIDGAGELTILFKILFPCCKSTVAVLILYYGVAYWNAWFESMLYIETREKFPLQLILREIVMYNQIKDDVTAAMDREDLSETISYATIIVATVPILVIYPFMQRYFEKGVMLGAVKG